MAALGGRMVWHSTTAMRQEAFLGMRMMVRMMMTIVVMIIMLIMAVGRRVV